MRSGFKPLVIPSTTLVVALLLATLALAAKVQTFTGTVSDAMCGATHMMEGDPASCLRTCVNKGSKYALVVGDKVYTLDASNQATLDALAKLAAQKATVKGTVDGDTISVSSVAAARYRHSEVPDGETARLPGFPRNFLSVTQFSYCLRDTLC
jgi:hypothetical protein